MRTNSVNINRQFFQEIGSFSKVDFVLSGKKAEHFKQLRTDLGTLPRDFFSFGEAVNDGGQVGGYSSDINFNCRGFLWQRGVMTDLNTLIPAGSPLFLFDILSINSHAQIAATP